MGGEVQKKKSLSEGKLNEKKSYVRQITLKNVQGKAYKIHTREMFFFMGLENSHPPHNFFNGLSLISFCREYDH